ncbi:MAG TPA: M1 family metallopeptidase [Candidatus Saccharimonadales bacterium]|nr:M1 family metallopeptidase [Candidatus Saccharimonadales bacterium]
MQNVARLIEHFIPTQYDLFLNLDRAHRSFDGTVTIHGTSPELATKIMVHAKGLDISSVTFDGKAADFSLGNTDELTITHDDIKSGDHVVVLTFSGKIDDAMHGLYPCYYEHDGVKKELLATQFESHHAREVFPCIDEPEAKAIFNVTLATEQGVTVLGNMPVKTQREEDDKLVTQFETTPRMSTYLLAWVTGELQRKTAETKDGVEVNIWATPAQHPDSLDFALQVATRTIDFFNDYFGIPYPLPKSDHVALPDFSAGAMENWGLITYRELALLADPKTAGISNKQYVALVVAHELSHQWFGNLVTMKWWNNLWLNESFATLMEYIAVDALYPEWNMWLEFSTSESILALRRDSIDGVQPVQTDVHHPDEINTLFDGAIVYAKGARLLRMLQQYIGKEDFRTGLQHYFKMHAYTNTEETDLWTALSSASGKDIARFMHAWISQPGYPVVSITKTQDTLRLSQQQFFIGPHEASNRAWPIPLNASLANIPSLLDTKNADFPPQNETFRLNVGDSAHFITQYDKATLESLIEAVQKQALPPLDRLQLLHEQTLLARSGLISSASLIPLVQAYKNETEESVWNIIALAAGELRKFVETDETSEEKLRKLYRELARAQYKRLGWEKQTGETEAHTKLRATVISMMLYGKDPEAIKHALSLFASSPLESLDSELRTLVISTAIREGDDPHLLDSLLHTYATTVSPDLREDIGSAITSARRPEYIEKILTSLKDETIVRPQDATHWFVWTIRNRYGRAQAWQWLQRNWPWIKETFGTDKSYDAFPRYSASALTNRSQLAEYRSFFTPLASEPALTRVIALGISELEGKVELIERDTSAVKNALDQL